MGWGIKTEELHELDKSNERKADRVINKRKEKNNHVFFYFFYFFSYKAIVTRNTELKSKKKKTTESIENKEKRCRRNRCRSVRSFARLWNALKTTTNRLGRHIAKDPRPPNLFHFSAAHPSLDRYARINPACMNIHVFTFLSSMTVILNPPAEKKNHRILLCLAYNNARALSLSEPSKII